MLATWTALFVGINMVYLPLKEEPDLVRRFGDNYRKRAALAAATDTLDARAESRQQ